MNKAIESLSLSPTAQATLLLTSYFSKVSTETIKPLTIAQWGRFALWLKEKNLTPADLLISDPHTLLHDWHDPTVNTDRIIQLLNRGHSLALAVEKWRRAGIWIVTRSDSEYPKRLKKRLKTDAPPVLFGCGEKTLLNAKGLAVIGSRNAGTTDLSFTHQLGIKAASEGIAIVSGGARGVDEAAMLGGIEGGGLVLGILADGLLKAAISAKWRTGLMAGSTVLVSPFYPEAGFNVGHAMARNKYIYCMADSALVIHCGKKGGTISGALENLKMGWVSLWVKPTSDENSANADLVATGAKWCKETVETIRVCDLIDNRHMTPPNTESQIPAPADQPVQTELFADPQLNSDEALNPHLSQASDETPAASPMADLQSLDFYSLFVAKIKYLAVNPVTLDELVEVMDVNKSQMNLWLKKALEQGIIKKLNRPVRYQIHV